MTLTAIPAVAPEADVQQLTGEELLAKVTELGDVPKTVLVRSCGYVTHKKDGSERLNFTSFYEALLEAKGVNLRPAAAERGPIGRQASYRTRVQFNGNLMVGKAYTSVLGLSPGDQFEIQVEPGEKRIHLVPVQG